MAGTTTHAELGRLARERLWALREAVPRWRGRAVRPLVRDRFMRFPTFDPAVHAAATGHYDYARYATLGLAVQRVRDERIAGAFAEVGVWRGEMAAFLHGLAPERRYFLFDTFAGFPEDRDATARGDTRFRDTSLELVRRRLGGSPQLVFRPGFVPDTLAGLEDERFAFVLLDLDLLAPTVASLEFFYPRLARGGYLVVHDYNNPESDWACKRALDGFLADKPEHVVEVGDVWGTALLRKV